MEKVVQVRGFVAAPVHESIGKNEKLAIVKFQGNFTGLPFDFVDPRPQIDNAGVKTSGI
ncbi:hypothetical protein HEB29_003957 [Streptomyces fulvorobeus]|uniref:Uncharacterized protein n=1 Tax=Streptomyces fulvorobeus TaxID=284028 RepID=A0A7Y9HEU9_9ACTN|nr:hypothetical protein [Streptomyces fulvorobeus]